MSLVKISAALLKQTVDVLLAASSVERVVLWLGRRQAGDLVVMEVFVPIQETEADFFRIPPDGMADLLARLRDQRLMVVAQVHSHPFEAFHSPADDRWAVVSHVGALSLVVPDFCQNTTAISFVDDAKVYRLVDVGRFAFAPAADVYEVTP